MKRNGFLTTVGCGLLAAFLLSFAGTAVSAAPEEETAVEESAGQTEEKSLHSTEEASDGSVSGDSFSSGMLSSNSVSGSSISSNEVSGNRIPAKKLLRPSGRRRNAVSSNSVSGNRDVSGNTVSGDSVSRNGVSGNASSSASVSENSVSGNRISKSAVSENTVSENRVSRKMISGNTVSGNSVSGNAVSENDVSGNSVSGNAVSRNGVSGNAVSGNHLPDPALERRELTLKERQKVMSSHRQTMRENERDQRTISENDIDFSEIKIACLGDSITQAVNLDSLEDYQKLAYPNILKEALGAKEAVNLGIGGSSIGRYWADAFVDRYTQIPEDTDLILVMGGTNDGFCASFVEFGNSEERAERTFWGDLDELMDGLAEDYPDAEVIFLTPLPNSLQDYLKEDRKYLVPQEKFGEVIRILAGEHGMEVFDLYNSNILDGHDKDNVLHLMPDGVHPNEEGYRILGEHIAAEIIRLLDGRKEAG